MSESVLSKHKLAFEDIPPKARKGGKGAKMPKSHQTNEAKTSKRYTKTRGEHYKDIVIAILVTAVIGFIAGMHFSNKQQAQVNSAVQAATVSANVEAKK